MHTTIAATIAAAGLLLTPAAASADWPAHRLSAHALVDRPRISFTGNGTAFASWTWQDGTGRGARGGASSAVRGPGWSAFEDERALVPARPLRRPITLVGAEAYGRDRVLVARIRTVSGAVQRLEVQDGAAALRRTPPRIVASTREFLRTTLAVNARGDAALAWWERSGGRSRLYASVRRAGGRFGAPVRLAATGFGDVAVAVGASGDVLVAWESGGAVRTRTRARTRRVFGPVRRAGSAPAPQADVEAAVAPNGRAVVAWAAQRATEGGELGPIAYAAAVRPASAARFRHEQVLETQAGGARRAAPVRLVMDPSGRATVAWTSFDGADERVAAARTRGGLDFGGARMISAPGADARPAALATGSDGRLLLVWVAGAEETGRIEASEAPPAGEFGPPEVVAAGPQASVPDAALHPRTGRPTVVWSERPAGATRSEARAATRP